MTAHAAADVMSPELAAALAADADRVERALEVLLPERAGEEASLFAAMRYATLGGGKRIRPFLALESARLFDIAESCSLRVAAAIEMAHCYSLAHDDLPAMDDDDLRRGKPSLHRAFDEATAILAGDALLTRAFEVIVDPPTHGDPGVRAELALQLARAVGAEGMVGSFAGRAARRARHCGSDRASRDGSERRAARRKPRRCRVPVPRHR